MKNPDGSDFKGSNPTKEELAQHGVDMTPEEAIQAQFIQQQSKNFRESFDSPVLDEAGNIQTNYHGSPNKFNKFDVSSAPSSDKTGARLGEGLYTTPERSMAAQYADKNKDGGYMYHLYQNARKKQDAHENIDKIIDGEISKLKKDLANGKITEKEGNKIFDKIMEKNDRMWDELSDNDFKLQKGYDYFKTGDEQIVPFSNIPKSLIGNRGTFDMSNSNIYKAIAAPVGFTGLVASILNKKE